MWLTPYLTILALFFIGPTSPSVAPPALAFSAPRHPRLIAHAGGGINNYRYTNSLEAINKNYDNGFRFFEIDFEETADGQIVLLHDWDYSITHFYKATPKIYTLEEFKNLTLQTNLTQLTLNDLTDWLKEHPGSYIITDFKRTPLKFLKNIAQQYPDLKERFIPQIYSFNQYQRAVQLGYPSIILTLYTSSYNDQEILQFAKKYPLWAITMSKERAERSGLAMDLKTMGVVTYSHLVDDQKTLERMFERGVYGVYTAFLSN